MKILKRVVLALLVLIVVLVGAVAAVLGPVFSGGVPQPDDAELAPGVRQIKDGMSSVVLIDGGGGQAALIDCGNDDKGIAVLAALKSHNISADQVTSIFLTHGHPDHTAACHLFPKAEVYAFAPDVPLAAGEATSKGWLVSKMGATPKGSTIKVTKQLTDAQEVPVGNLTVRAFSTPGHTQGSASYLVNGVLALGDNAMGKTDGVHGAPGPMSDDLAQNKDSLKKLYERLSADGSVKTLEFAHTGPIQGLDPLKTIKD
jgi:glyoxylase-like metal-dependent hydrolase (beta-lactamase superfamily II)